MKSLTRYIQEKLIIKKSIVKQNKRTNYNYFTESKEELKDIIEKRIKKEGNEVDLNDIDVSNITDMSGLFYDYGKFNGDISKWDVSNVNDMNCMFCGCTSFDQDISSWDVSKVNDTSDMFAWCHLFNKDISTWDVSNVTNTSEMFYGCKSFNQDISNWNVSNVRDMHGMFSGCPIEKNINQNLNEITNTVFRRETYN